MYRRVNSNGFMVIATFLIVIVMAIFTWVMYGMAQQVLLMTDMMVELNDSFKAMVVTQDSMARDIHAMSGAVAGMQESIGAMQGDVAAMTASVEEMTGSVAVMTGAMARMDAAMGKMTYEVSQATYAVSHPMTYMFGKGPFGF